MGANGIYTASGIVSNGDGSIGCPVIYIGRRNAEVLGCISPTLRGGVRRANEGVAPYISIRSLLEFKSPLYQTVRVAFPVAPVTAPVWF